MVTVALAGASTGFGLTMLHAFIRNNKDSKHKIVLLSRSSKPELTAKGVDVRPVDYANHSQLVSALKDVHTLLSVIGGDMTALHDAQLALIAAAKDADVKRFAPSEYAGIGYDGIDLYAPKAEVWDVARRSGMEVTRFSCGLFMSVLATGTTKPLTPLGISEGKRTGEEEALAGLRPWNFIMNMKNGTADYPGDGNAELVLTDTRDVALFVFHALDLPKWQLDCGMRGDVKSWKELVAIVERVQGRKFLTKDNPVEDMIAEAKAVPGKAFYNQTRVAFAKGWGMVPDDLNRAFPDVKPTSCEEFVEKWWRGVEVGKPSWEDGATFDADDFKS